MDVVILGAGGHGRVVLEILRAAGKFRPVGFLDANASLSGVEIADIPVLGSVNQLPRLTQQKIRGAIVAIGDNRVRRSYARLVIDAGIELINAIHPSAVIATTASLGSNIVIAPGAIVCTDAKVDDSSIINTGAVIDHECQISEGAHICPGALLAGRVRVGTGAFVGMGAKIIQCLTIGDEAIVGAGAVVLSDVPDGVTVVGVPARVVKSSLRAAG
jgi:sugar O-acyltransferase (sialic acid O-acetyltransferase NeuD family)